MSATIAEEAMRTIPHVVQRVQKETNDTFSLFLEAAPGQPSPAFAPGQFNMLYVFGAGEIPISISGDPAKPGVLTHTTRTVGVVTNAMSKLARGDALGVRGPFGSFWPLAEAEGHDVVMVAGGIGLAPLRPAILHLLANRERYGKVVLLYGMRTQEDILFRRDLAGWGGRFDVQLFVTVDRGTRGWRGNVGVVTTLIPRAPFDARNAIAFICGPEVMMRFTVQELLKRGMQEDKIHVSMERNMKCGVGLCGHCQYGPHFICKDGPIFRFDQVKRLFTKWEI